MTVWGDVMCYGVKVLCLGDVAWWSGGCGVLWGKGIVCG